MNAHTRSHAWIRAVHARTALNEGNERTYTWIRAVHALTRQRTHTHTLSDLDTSQLFHTIPIIHTCALRTSPQLLSRLLRACVRKLSTLLHVMQTSRALALRTVSSAASRPPGVRRVCILSRTLNHLQSNHAYVIRTAYRLL